MPGSSPLPCFVHTGEKVPMRMIRKPALILVSVAMLCAACSGGSSQSAQLTTLKVVGFDPSAAGDNSTYQQQLPNDPLNMGVTQVNGYACFTLSNDPLVWPSGSYAQVGPNG